jgi:hypothetical protein
MQRVQIIMRVEQLCNGLITSTCTLGGGEAFTQPRFASGQVAYEPPLTRLSYSRRCTAAAHNGITLVRTPERAEALRAGCSRAQTHSYGARSLCHSP